MKICYLANSRFPSERAHMTQIVQMCNAFAQNGHHVTLLVTDRRTDITETPESYFGTKIHFSIERIKVPDIAGRASRIPGFLRPYMFFIQRVAFVYQSFRYIQKHAYELLYGRDEWVLWLLSQMTVPQIVWESHEARFSFVSRRLLKKINRVIVISEGLRDFYYGHGVPSANILVAHDAVDARFFMPHISKHEAQSRLGITAHKPVVLYIGEFDTWKGVDTIFAISNNDDLFEVCVIGGKELEIQSLSHQYPRVHFLGRKPYRELPEHQQAADVLVIPNTAKNTLSEKYTSPLKLFAYMTSKRPIVASRIASIENVVSDEEVYFFTPDNASNLRDVILSVLQAPDKGAEKALRAYTKSMHHTWQKRAKDIIDFIHL